MRTTPTSDRHTADTSILAQFFSPITTEEQFILREFTSSTISEILELEPFFTADEMVEIVSCKSPEQCFRTTTTIVSEVRGTRERLAKMFAKKQ